MKRFGSLLMGGLLLVPALLAGQSPRDRARPKVAGPPPEPTVWTLAPSGNQARFVVREQLARAELPNDAIGSTSAITGGILLTPEGAVDSAGSRISVDLTTLRSDRDMRDRFIKRRTIVTDSFPTAVLVVTGLRGLPVPLPASGTLTLTLVGNLTIHGVTRRSSWDVTAEVSGGEITGRAVTHIKFGDFGMEQPRVAIVLSVVDDVRLEYDFHLTREAAAQP